MKPIPVLLDEADPCPIGGRSLSYWRGKGVLRIRILKAPI